ncbi:SPW repeat protein (plasmid) [Phyllobacterium sp. A18/5-2]|uniref:SPW repeat protein n=1 Tax=Phyllobacterium sp. A18/5-2 TaxID=2978392 RepID=UPI0021C92ACA|nr:SPW repeat protein [Phyllobacterium sp. A18/5-2]UXN66563.1 SPW repeat protein [Phyllobacterium sp. A18/5-2]
MVAVNRQHWQNILVAMIGVWLVASPWLLDYSSPNTVGRDIALKNFTIVGIALFFIGFMAIANHRLWQEWLDVAVAVWLIISPWALGLQAMPTAMWNAIICGLAVIGISGWIIFFDRSARAL